MTWIRGWEWGARGVDLYDDHVTFFEREGPVRFASGAACDQMLDDFLARGPWVEDLPADVLGKLTDAVRSVVATRGAASEPPAAAPTGAPPL